MNTDRLKHLGATVRSLVMVGVVFGLLKWDEAQIATVVLAVETLGALIFASNAVHHEAEKGQTLNIFATEEGDLPDAVSGVIYQPERDSGDDGDGPLAPVIGFRPRGE